MRRTAPSSIPAFVVVVTSTQHDYDSSRARAEREQRLREQFVVDPLVGDTITCAALAQREQACWRDHDARWPPGNGIPPRGAPERDRAIQSYRMCRRRSRALQQLCRVERVRAG
jgi:hypothetical protein